jgi:hypothetical protein
MTDLTLVRDVATSNYTYGVLTLGDLTLQTLELGWLPEPGALCGRPDRSCVPAGVYDLVLHDSAKHPKTWALVNPDLGIYHEPGDAPAGVGLCRFATLLHTANWPSELEGCIGVGMVRETRQPPAIWQSVSALNLLRDALPWIEGHTLTIGYAPGVTPP